MRLTSNDLVRRAARALYTRIYRRRGVLIDINSKRYRVSSSVARGIPRSIDAPALRHWLALVRGCDAAVDAGANIGVWSVLAAAEMPQGARIVAIEPAPAAFEILADCARVADGHARIIPVHAALGDHGGVARLTLDGPIAATNRLSPESGGNPGTEVPLRTLDSVLAELTLDAAVIKIDVEGAELSVLRGASRTLTSVRPTVVLELHWFTELGVTPEAILELSREYRYALYGDDGRVVHEPEALLRENFVVMRPA